MVMVRPVLAFMALTIATLGLPSSASAEGDLQIVCQAGVRIYIDEVYMGTTTTADEGLFIDGLADGEHTLLARARGFRRQSKKVHIQGGRLLEVRLEFIREQERIDRLERGDIGELELAVGILELRAVPPRPRATVSIDNSHKGSGDLRVSGVTAGRRVVKWQRGGENLEYVVQLSGGETIALKADFRNMTVIDLTEIERRRKAQEAEQQRQQEEARRAQESLRQKFKTLIRCTLMGGEPKITCDSTIGSCSGERLSITKDGEWGEEDDNMELVGTITCTNETGRSENLTLTRAWRHPSTSFPYSVGLQANAARLSRPRLQSNKVYIDSSSPPM